MDTSAPPTSPKSFSPFAVAGSEQLSSSSDLANSRRAVSDSSFEPPEPDIDLGFTSTEEALLSALERERASATTSNEVAGIILHEMGNLTMGLAASTEPEVEATFDRLKETIEGLQILFDQTKAIDYQLVDVSEVLKHALRGFVAVATIDTARSQRLLCLCPSLITQIVYNITRNGAKYAGKDSRIVIRTGTAEGHLNIFIHNKGIPMAPDLAHNLFRGRVEKCHGMGLGLLICHKCATRMGGTIGVRSHSAGTTFMIKVPVFEGCLRAY